MLAILDGNWKLLRNPSGDRIELYDTASDPTELNNLTAAYPSVVERLSRMVLEWQRSLPEGPVIDGAGSNSYPWPRPGPAE